MKLQILSDLHIELAPCEFQRTDADVVILAGDIHLGQSGFKWALENITDQKVIYVLGNHEFYYEATPQLIRKLKQLSEGTHVYVLENNAVTIQGVRFLGCTLWSDFQLLGDMDVAIASAQLNSTDFQQIRMSPQYRKIKPSDTVVWHNKTRRWIAQEIESRKDGKIVIVSHHAPSIRSIPEKDRSNPLSAAFASNMDDFIKWTDAELWIHGHIHESFDYAIGKTRVVCNPLGNINELNDRFNPELTIVI
jgi:Icc-related predicted phosphoesterase